jgi:CheY-like chemotaxis protein
MAYNILYIEDGDPDSTISDLKKCEELTVVYHDPLDFEGSINAAQSNNVDLLLLDFRLSDKKGVIYDAPTLAQTLRTQHSKTHRDIPIVLVSSEDKISDFYKDYTSQDLFDFAISKQALSEQHKKYTGRIKSLVDAYSVLKKVKKENTSILSLLNIPASLEEKFDARVKDIIDSNKIKDNIFMASDFLLNRIVKPSGILIGEDILAARLGVSTSSPSWSDLKAILDDFKFTGVFSDTYERWWFGEVDLWWKSISPENPSLKRLSATQRVEIIRFVLDLSDINVAQKSAHSQSDYFWTICSQSLQPLDPIDGFEKNVTKDPWIDKTYFSIEGASSLESLNQITTIDRKRYIEYTE